ncbi:MAG: sulfotransferase family 2 domain-containing protein, partial [Pseudomonadota bacterium]
DHKFIFLKTKKTAGTSIEMYFQDYCVPPELRAELAATGASTQTQGVESQHGIVAYRGPRDPEQKLYNHMSAAEVRAYAPDLFENYFKFTVVRNPYDKVVSFFWHRNRKREELKNPDFETVRYEFKKWLKAVGVRPRDRSVYSIDGNLVVDYCIRYESLMEGLEHVCRVTGIPYEPDRLGTFKGGYHAVSRPYQDYYDDETREMVRKFFAPDLSRFGYAF